MLLSKTVCGWNTTFSEGTTTSSSTSCKKTDMRGKDLDAKWSSILKQKSSHAFPRNEISPGDIKRMSKDNSVRKRTGAIYIFRGRGEEEVQQEQRATRTEKETRNIVFFRVSTLSHTRISLQFDTLPLSPILRLLLYNSFYRSRLDSSSSKTRKGIY